MSRYHLIDTRSGEIARELSRLPRPTQRRRLRIDPTDLKIAAALGILVGLLVSIH